MRLIDTIFISISVGFFLIGLHQVFIGNFMKNYWLFMITIVLLIVHQMIKNKREEKELKDNPIQKTSKKAKKTKKR